MSGWGFTVSSYEPAVTFGSTTALAFDRESSSIPNTALTFAAEPATSGFPTATASLKAVRTDLQAVRSDTKTIRSAIAKR